MADIFTKEKRSKIMSKIKSRNTKLELDFLKQVSSDLYPKGYRYRKHPKGIYGTPDIAFPKYKLAVFIDSEFWHGFDFEKNKEALRTEFWMNKIEGNIARDRKVNLTLKKEGWNVLRLWAHEIKENPEKAISKIVRRLDNRRRIGQS